MDDEQPRIAILGAGPIGLEAALYARYLGYPARVVERAPRAAANVLALDEQVVGSYAELASRLGVSALRAQNAQWQPPAATGGITASVWHAEYLAPLAESDLIADVLHLGHEVVGVTRRDTPDDVAFEVHCRDAQGTEVIFEADIVIDTAGTNSPAWWEETAVDEELGFANPVADVYVVGSKGGAATCAEGLRQIRDLFAILGERDDLDVYATMPPID